VTLLIQGRKMASEIEDRVILSFSYFYFLHKIIF